jgi:phenylacetate-CoA ligase
MLKAMYDRCPIGLQNALLTSYVAWLERARYGKEFRESQQLLREMEWRDRATIEAYQHERLRALINHAYETVPYYRRRFDDIRLKPSDIRDSGDLWKIPLLNRADIKRHLSDLTSRSAPRALTTGHTSGTTGSPLTVRYDASAIGMAYAALDRHYRWAGCILARNGDRIAVVRGNVIVPLRQRQGPYWRYNRRQNQLLLSSFHLSPTNLPLYFDEMKRFAPVVLDGYPSTLYILAKYLKNVGTAFPVKAVISSSETLYDFQRALIEERFACRVFDYFALAERVVFSGECERHEGHHLAMEYGIAEVLDAEHQPVKAGMPGTLVGTGLHNWGMPLIRYVTNDQASFKPHACSCGRALVLMDDVTTKAEDVLTLKDGRLISPSVLTHPFKPMDCIEASQIIQKDYDRIVIRLVPRSDYTPSAGATLVRELRDRLGEDVSIEIELTDALPQSTNGKFKWVISEVSLGI